MLVFLAKLFFGLTRVRARRLALPRRIRRLSLADLARISQDRVEADASGWFMDEYRCK